MYVRVCACKGRCNSSSCSARKRSGDARKSLDARRGEFRTQGLFPMCTPAAQLTLGVLVVSSAQATTLSWMHLPKKQMRQAPNRRALNVNTGNCCNSETGLGIPGNLVSTSNIFETVSPSVSNPTLKFQTLGQGLIAISINCEALSLQVMDEMVETTVRQLRS